jgi:hypothetical protein
VDVKDSVPLTKKWLLVQQIQEHFWTRFTQEYLSTLQKRYKWRHPNRNLAKGDLVIVKDLNLPPTNWKLGRVIEEFPDHHGQVRKVTICTQGKDSIQHATNQLVPLLPEEEQEEEPALRRSNRKPRKDAGLITKVLLCWLSLMTPIHSLNI